MNQVVLLLVQTVTFFM